LEVLWAYRCNSHSPTGETPYNLTYETDAMFLVEVRESTIHKQLADFQLNEECMRIELILLQELRDKAKV